MDRNKALGLPGWLRVLSLSARRAWIEMSIFRPVLVYLTSLSARRAWIEILKQRVDFEEEPRRSPQGERG